MQRAEHPFRCDACQASDRSADAETNAGANTGTYAGTYASSHQLDGDSRERS